MRIKRMIMLMAYTSLLAACAANAETKSVINNDPPSSNSGFEFSPIAHANTAELLNFISNYTKSSKEKQKSIYMDISQNLVADKGDIKLRVKQAAILALPESNLRNSPIAQQQLQALLIDQALNKSDKNLVNLLYVFTHSLNNESQKLRDSNKKIDALKQRNRALGQKLNDLKNIEKTMIERNVKTK